MLTPKPGSLDEAKGRKKRGMGRATKTEANPIQKKKEWTETEAQGGQTEAEELWAKAYKKRREEGGRLKREGAEVGTPRKLKTKKVQKLKEKTLDNTIIRTPPKKTPKKKKGVSAMLSKVASDAKGKDVFSGVLSPEKVEERSNKKVRKVNARTSKNEAKVKKILTRKQKQAARKGYTVHVENLEKTKGKIGNND